MRINDHQCLFKVRLSVASRSFADPACAIEGTMYLTASVKLTLLPLTQLLQMRTNIGPAAIATNLERHSLQCNVLVN